MGVAGRAGIRWCPMKWGCVSVLSLGVACVGRLTVRAAAGRGAHRPPTTYHMNAVVPFDEDDDQAKPPVVLVDDVLTTGATFRVCRKVLEVAGHEVLGGVWLALA